MARDASSGSGAGLDRMVALLTEVSDQLAESRAAIDSNAELVSKLAPAFATLAATLRGMPEGTKAAALAGARAGATEIERQLRYAASEGARAGTERVADLEDRLRGLLGDVRDRRERFIALLRIGLPLAFVGAVLLGLLLVHATVRWGVSVLPTVWEWPCSAIGADYLVTSSEPRRAACVVWRGAVR